MAQRLPPNASVAKAAEGAKLVAPAAGRNVDAICQMLLAHAPAKGRALELASGTGQHVRAFAAALPGLDWQPTEVEAARLRSIDAYAVESGLGNIRPARHLDATQARWSADMPPQDLVVLINLLHLIPAPAAETLITEVGHVLAPGGCFALYGPFSKKGVLTSAGDRRFDADLRGADPAIGYKDTRDIARWFGKAGLRVDGPYDMPANNLMYWGRKEA